MLRGIDMAGASRHRIIGAITVAMIVGCDVPTTHELPSAESEIAATLASTEALVKGPPSPSLEWERLTPLPMAVRAGAAVSDGKHIYVLGGNLTLATWTTLNQIYHPRTDTWRTGTPFEGARDFAMAAALSDGIHLIAGRDAQFKMDHQLYDPTTDSWSQRAPLPVAIDAAAIQSVGNKIYVIGGNNLNNPIATVHIYHPARDEWILGTPMPTPRFSAASTVVRGRILVAGGQVAGRQASNVLEAYHPGRNRWETLAPMPFESEALGGGVVMRGGTIGNHFCVFGGREIPATGMAFSDTFCYDPAKDTWTTGPDMLTPRVETAFAEHRGSVYAIGGRSPTTIATNVVERLQAMPGSRRR